MAVDISKGKYRLAMMDESGKQYDLKDFVDDLGWEEPENELSTRISFTLKNQKTDIGYLSNAIKPGRLLGIFFVLDGNSTEVARGYCEDWNPISTLDEQKLTIKCYDSLHPMEKSQDTIWYAAGAGTKSVLSKLFSDWGVPMGEYKGPNVTHGKLAFKGKNISDIINDVLDDAYANGADRVFIQERNGKVCVLPYGNNTTQYYFDGKIVSSASNKWSLGSMITRVKIMGQEDDSGKAAVEATLNGQTKYGIRQKIINRPKDDSLSKAKSDAQKVLDEDGKMGKTMVVKAPDIPYIKKGDVVKCSVSTIIGDFFVTGINHDIDNRTMTLTLHDPW